MNITEVQAFLINILNADKVLVSESNRVVTIAPVEETGAAKKSSCPFLGIAADSNLSVESFLEWKREERKAEYEKELRS